MCFFPNENQLVVHMRYHLFLHYGWFLQNLGKDFIWSFTPLFVSSLSVTKSLSLLFHLGHMSMSFHTLFIWWLLNTSHFPLLNSHTHKKKSCLILLVFAFPYLTVLDLLVQGYPTLSTNIMARMWNEVPGLQNATTLGAAKSLAKKWAKDIPR